MAAQKPLILFFNPVKHAVAAFRKLSLEAQTEVVTSTSRKEFFEDIKTKYKGAVAIYRTSASGSVS